MREEVGGKRIADKSKVERKKKERWAQGLGLVSSQAQTQAQHKCKNPSLGPSESQAQTTKPSPKKSP